MFIEFVKNIENNSEKFNINTQLQIRDRSIPLVDRILSIPPVKNPINDRLNYLVNATKSFLKNNPDIVFTRADKRNITVALDNNDYRK